MAIELTDKVVKALEAPETGNKIFYDEETKGFGLRVTSAGARAFILNYRAGARERRYTIGSFPDWKVSKARDEAKRLKREVDLGRDPMGERHEDRAAPTIADLADRFEAEHLPNRRSATVRDYKGILKSYIRPDLGKTKVADLRHSDVEKLHRTIAKTAPYRANRTVAVLSKMLSLAVKWEMRTDNPVRGIERAPEEKRERFLSPAEIGRLADALIAHPEKTSANALRLMMLTGARRGETLAAKWSEFDLERGAWVKPSAHTKSKREHRVPLSAPALALLVGMRQNAERRAENARMAVSPYVFPGTDNKPLTEVKRTWASVCESAGLGAFVEEKDASGKLVKRWQSDVRAHDLRHTFAAILAGSGLSLPIIGRLLGHTQAATTHRYAHLADDPLREATERVGAVVIGAGKPGAEVIDLPANHAIGRR